MRTCYLNFKLDFNKANNNNNNNETAVTVVKSPKGNLWSSLLVFSGRRSSQVVSAPDSGSRGPGSSPGWVICVLFFGKALYSHSPSPPGSINEYRRTVGEINEMLGGYLRWTSLPSSRSSNTPSCFMLQKPG